MTDLEGSYRSIEEWFLDKEDAVFAGASAQELLRSLIDEIPAQMQQAHEIILWRRACLLGLA